MNCYETIREYYSVYGHTPPMLDHFDIRPFEQYYKEDKTQQDTFGMEPFRVAFYGIGLLTDGTAQKHQGKPFDASVVLYSPYQVLSFEGVQRNWKGYYIMFDQDFLSGCSFSHTFHTDFPFLQLDKVHPVKLSKVQLNELLPVFRHIYHEFISDRNDKFVVIEICLNLLLHLLKRSTAGLEVEGGHRIGPDISLVARYRNLIVKHLASGVHKQDHLSPSFYAKRLNIHPNHLNAVVKSVTNKTAKQLIQDTMVVISKSLLLQTSLSAKEIGWKLGFEDPAHFTHFFKKNTMQTPSQFRKIKKLP